MEKLLPWVYGILTTTPARWQTLVDSLPAELIERRPAVQEWSALECLQHIIDVERVFQSRLQAFQKGEDFPAFDPDREGTRPVGELAHIAATFTQMRQASLAALQPISVQDLERRVRHQELGQVSLYEMLHEWAAHDLNHIVQAERALMQPFIQGCGPWQPYFSDHVIK